MGNGNCNCYRKTKEADKDFDVAAILLNKQEKDVSKKTSQSRIQNKEIEIKENEENRLLPTLNKKNEKSIISEFNYSIISNNNFRNYIENNKKERAEIKFNKLIKKQTFGQQDSNFIEHFRTELNNIRKNPLEFSKELSYYAENFELIEEIVNEFTDELLLKYFKRTKEDFEKAALYFKGLNEVNKEGFTDLIEVEEIRCPIQEELSDMVGTKFKDKFHRRFLSKFRDVFKLKKNEVKIVFKDLKKSMLFYFSHNELKWKEILVEENSFIGLDFKENELDSKTNFVSLVLAKKIN